MRTETAINALIQRSGGTPQPEDYFGADGLLYCGKCNTPKQAFFEGHKRVPILGDRHPVECQCSTLIAPPEFPPLPQKKP